MAVLMGYHQWEAAPPCPYCGSRYYCVEDDDDDRGYLIRCWCGATCRCRRDDKDMMAHLARGVR